MSLADQFQNLGRQAASFRQEIFSRDANGAPQMARMEEPGSEPFRCYFTPVKTQEQLDRAMFHGIYDTIVRVAKSETDCRAVIGKTIRLIAVQDDGSDLVVMIGELGYSGLNPEWVLGCKNAF